jgi:signal transduction histidine kinase
MRDSRPRLSIAERLTMLRSLRFRLVASFILIVTVTLSVAGVTLYARLDKYRDDLSASTLRTAAAPIYYNIALFNVPQGQRPGLAGQRLRAELTQYIDLTAKEGVLVIPVDASGAFIRGDGPSPEPGLDDEHFVVPPAPERGPSFSELPLYEYTTSEGDRIVYVSVPMTRLIRAQREGIHAIIVATPETSRQDALRDLMAPLVVAGGAGLAVALAVIALVWLSLYRPLAKVGRSVRAVAEGDYAQRLPAQGPTEMRDLALDVNKMADSVQASQRTLREFLANVSHELKTPLTSIRGFSEALIDGTLDTPDERARAARVIDAESRRVLQLVGELLDLSRIESGQQKMELADVRVDDLLQHMADVFAIRAADAGISLNVGLRSRTGDVEHPPGRRAEGFNAPLIHADFDRLEQVLGNLLDNAFRHTSRGGRIEIGARPLVRFVELYVADDGAGIAPADLPHIFDRFYRSQLGEPDMPGAGLGLAIAREIVRAHGGTIRASARTGGGAEFAFTIPAAPSSPVARAPRASEGTNSSPAPQT